MTHSFSVFKYCLFGSNIYIFFLGDEVQTLFCSATAGTFTLSFRGRETSPIPFNAKNMGEWKSLGTGTITTYSSIIASTNADFRTTIGSGSIINLYSNSGRDTRNYTVASVASNAITLTEPIGMTTETGVLIRFVTPSIKTSLEELTSIGIVNVTFSTGEVACSSSGVYIHIGFLSNFGDLPLMTTTNSLTGGSGNDNYFLKMMPCCLIFVVIPLLMSYFFCPVFFVNGLVGRCTDLFIFIFIFFFLKRFDCCHGDNKRKKRK